jgi:hypothetical protein
MLVTAPQTTATPISTLHLYGNASHAPQRTQNGISRKNQETLRCQN